MLKSKALSGFISVVIKSENTELVSKRRPTC